MTERDEELSPGSDDIENEYEVVVQWIGGQEQWLELDGKTNELIMDEWSSISELYHEAQGIIESIFTHESSLHEFLKTLPASDKRLEILQRWNDIIPRLLRHYQDALEITLTFEEKFIESVEQLIDCSRTICNASNSEIVTSFPITNQGYQSLEEILKRLNKELQLIANISQCVKPMYLVSGDIDVNDSSWKMTVLEEKDHEDASEDSTYSRVTTATHKIDLLSIECRELITQLEKKCETLVDEVSRNNDGLMKGLEEMEAWLVQVQQLLWVEPHRMFDSHGSLTRESSMYTEDIDDVDHHEELLVDGTPSPYDDDNLYSPDDPSLDEEDMGESLPPPNLDYEDESYPGGVANLTSSDCDFEQYVEDEVFTPDTPQDKEFELELPSPEKLQPLKFDLDESSHAENNEENDMGMVDIGEEIVAMEGPMEEQRKEEESEGQTSSEEESSSTRTDDTSLEWVRHIGLFEYRHSSADEDIFSNEGRISYSDLIHQLQSVESSIEEQCEKKDKVLDSREMLMLSAKSPEQSRELELRLDNIEKQWKTLSKRIKCRLTEIKFELAQTEILQWLLDAKSELDALPKYLLLPEDMEKALMDHKVYFEENQLLSKDQLLSAVSDALEELCDCHDNEDERVSPVLTSLQDAIEKIYEKIIQRQEELQDGLDMWEEFDSVATPLNDWIESVTFDVKEREVYGYTLEEAEQFMKAIVVYRESLRDKYEMLSRLVAYGNSMVNIAMENTSAYNHIDSVVRGTTRSWEDLVALLSGTEEELSYVLITWQEYRELHGASRDFIDHIHQISGGELVSSSCGDVQFLPKFVQLQNEIETFQAKLDRLHLVKKKLTSHSKVGGSEAIKQEMLKFESDWSTITGITQNSLKMLWSEHDSWLNDKITIILNLIISGEELIKSEIEFALVYPLNQIMNYNAFSLLHDLNNLIAINEDKLFDLGEKIYQIQSEIEIRQKKVTETSLNNNELVGSLTNKLSNLNERWISMQDSCSTMRSVFKLMTAQLEMAVGLQEMKSRVQDMSQFAGYPNDIKVKMEEAKDVFSEYKFETLRQLSYDLDTIYRDIYMGLDKESVKDLKLPSNQEVLKMHQQLNGEIDTLEKGAAAVNGRFLLLFDWWNEYLDKTKVYWDWSQSAEDQVNYLQDKMSDKSSHERIPHDLYDTAKDLMEEVSTNESLYNSLSTTVQNLIHDFNDKNVSPLQLSTELTNLQQNWTALTAHVVTLHDELKTEVEELDEYLNKLSTFSEKLNMIYSEVYDEYCTAIAPNATPETIEKQKIKMEKFLEAIESMSEEFNDLRKLGERWGFQLLPNEWIEQFREMSPALSDDGELQHQSVGRQLSTSEGRLSAMKKMLQERYLDLELCEGNAGALLSSANELLDWVEETLGFDLLNKAPPGELNKLLENKESLKNLRAEFESRKQHLERLHQLATTTKGSLSEANLAKIETLMAQLDAAWNKMEEAVHATTNSTEEILKMMEDLNNKCLAYEEWLHGANQVYDECGPIAADMERIQQQEVILEDLESDILNHKKMPEDFKLTVTDITKIAEEGTADTLNQRILALTNDYMSLGERVAEKKELCEEAKKNLQDFATKEEPFNKMIEKVTKDFTAITSKPIRPIGNIQATLDEHVDYCIEVESQSVAFDDMNQLGRFIASHYPCDKFTAHLSSMFDQWIGFVDTLDKRWLRIRGIQHHWHKYEGKVKEFLNWVTEEAKAFSQAVTTNDGEKDVYDHMESCKKLHATINDKTALRNEISELADTLQPDDGEKPNGTKDVDSRLNDINTHWTSICQLLEETLGQLSSVYQKLNEIEEITKEECQWMEQIIATADKVPTQGVMQVLNQEINRHKVYIDEIEEHKPAIEVIIVTESFVLEHTKKSTHAATTQRVKDLKDKFDNLEGSERIYVENLVQSVPLWEEFNRHKEGLAQWVEEADGIFNSDKLRPGNAFVTEQNLKNAEGLFNDIEEHKPGAQLLGSLMKQLSQFCLPDDYAFISEQTNQITAHIDTLGDSTESRMTLLGERLQSWQAFPNQEAKNVQDFLDAIANEINDDEEEEEGEDEELTGEELMKKLEYLESLQDQQATKEVHLETIDKSAENQEVQKALQNNPDILKERDNLLQGWNKASIRLSDKVVTMRLKAEMTLKLEKAIQNCTLALDRYQNHIALQLPPTPSLIKIHDKLIQDEDVLAKDYNHAMNALLKCCHDYKDDPRIQIPKKFNDKVTELQNQHTALKQAGAEWTNRIVERVRGWEQYCPLLKRFSQWTGISKSELSALRMFPVFLQEFMSLTARFQMLEDIVQKKMADFQYLQENFEVHLFTEENNDENEREIEPPLQENLETLEYRNTFLTAKKQWEYLMAGIESFPQEMKPWEEVVLQYEYLHNWYERTNEKLHNARNELLTLEREEANTARIVENCKTMVNEHANNTQSLEQLNEAVKTLITPDHCNNYGTAQGFVEQCRELNDGWLRLQRSLNELHAESEEKTKMWERRALAAMRDIRIKDNELINKDEEIVRLNDRIRDLENQTPPPRRTPSPPPLLPQPSFCRRLFSFMLLRLLPLLLLLLLAFSCLFLYSLKDDASALEKLAYKFGLIYHDKIMEPVV